MRTPPAAVPWSSILLSGLCGGAVLALAALLVPQSYADLVRSVAAILVMRALGDPLDAGIVAAAVVVHATLSIIYAMAIASLVRASSMGLAVVLGAAFALLLYVMNFHGFTYTLPRFAQFRGVIMALAHVLFGVVTAAVYVSLRARPLRFGRPPEVRVRT